MRKVYQDISRYVSAELFIKLIGVVSFLYVGRILVPDEFGYYAMALFVISLGGSFAEFGGASLIIRDLHIRGWWCLVRALPVALGVWVLGTSVILVAGTPIWRWNQAFVALKDHPFLISGLLLTSTLNGLVATYLIVSQRAGFYAFTAVAKSMVQMTLLVVLVSYARSYTAQLYALAMAELVCLCIPLICYRHRVADYAGTLISRDVWLNAIGQMRAGFVFFSKDLISVFQMYLSRIIVSAYLPIAALGIYSFFFNIVMSLSFLMVSVDRVYTPRMIRMYADNPERQRGLLSSVIPVTGVVSVLGYLLMIAGGEVGLYRLAFRWEYVANSHVLDGMLFPIVTASLLQIISYSYFIGEKNNSTQKQAVLNLIFVVVLQFALVPRYGLHGAVAAEIWASTLRLFSLWVLNRQILQLRSEPLKLAWLVPVCATSVSLSLFQPSAWVVFALVILGAIGVYTYASIKGLQQFYRLTVGNWRIATSSDSGSF